MGCAAEASTPTSAPTTPGSDDQRQKHPDIEMVEGGESSPHSNPGVVQTNDCQAMSTCAAADVVETQPIHEEDDKASNTESLESLTLMSTPDVSATPHVLDLDKLVSCIKDHRRHAAKCKNADVAMV